MSEAQDQSANIIYKEVLMWLCETPCTLLWWENLIPESEILTRKFIVGLVLQAFWLP